MAFTVLVFREGVDGDGLIIVLYQLVNYNGSLKCKLLTLR